MLQFLAFQLPQQDLIGLWTEASDAISYHIGTQQSLPNLLNDNICLFWYLLIMRAPFNAMFWSPRPYRFLLLRKPLTRLQGRVSQHMLDLAGLWVLHIWILEIWKVICRAEPLQVTACCGSHSLEIWRFSFLWSMDFMVFMSCEKFDFWGSFHGFHGASIV